VLTLDLSELARKEKNRGLRSENGDIAGVGDDGRSHNTPESFEDREHDIIECAAEPGRSPKHNSIVTAGEMMMNALAYETLVEETLVEEAPVEEDSPALALGDHIWSMPSYSQKSKKKGSRR
jgi:hypothetical protein